MRKNKYTMKQRLEASRKVINIYRDEISKLYDYIKDKGLEEDFRNYKALKDLMEINERKEIKRKSESIPYNVMMIGGGEHGKEDD